MCVKLWVELYFTAPGNDISPSAFWHSRTFVLFLIRMLIILLRVHFDGHKWLFYYNYLRRWTTSFLGQKWCRMTSPCQPMMMGGSFSAGFGPVTVPNAIKRAIFQLSFSPGDKKSPDQYMYFIFRRTGWQNFTVKDRKHFHIHANVRGKSLLLKVQKHWTKIQYGVKEIGSTQPGHGSHIPLWMSNIAHQKSPFLGLTLRKDPFHLYSLDVGRRDVAGFARTAARAEPPVLIAPLQDEESLADSEVERVRLRRAERVQGPIHS